MEREMFKKRVAENGQATEQISREQFALRKAVLTRMGSFNSSQKINNIDSQDDKFEVPQGLNRDELIEHIKQLRGENKPELLSRYFIRPFVTSNLLKNSLAERLRHFSFDYEARKATGPNMIRLLQWNILSQSLGQNNDGFICCPEEALTWECRKFLIVEEILRHNPDVICLQEVDHFKFLDKILSSQNYEGLFFPKPDSPCLYIENNNGPDGCAIFFKRDKFELQTVAKRILEVWRVQSNQVAIAVNLIVKATKQEVCICTTHLKARDSALLAKLRNEQGCDLLNFVKNISQDRPVLLCGDFNAEPVEPVYATMLSNSVLKLASAYANVNDGTKCKQCSNLKDLNLFSSKNYSIATGAAVVKGTSSAPKAALIVQDQHINCCNHTDEINKVKEKRNTMEYVLKSISDEPKYTTWKIREEGEVCHTIDYIFYSKDYFKIKNCLEFPVGEDIGENRTPSFQYPSDHFSLLCDFELMSGIQQSHQSEYKEDVVQQQLENLQEQLQQQQLRGEKDEEEELEEEELEQVENAKLKPPKRMQHEEKRQQKSKNN